VYSWGNGANYQLGIGTAGIQRIPCRLDALQTLDVTHVAAAKFHSAAVTASGDVYTWGFGRGGRLGHPDFDIHRFSPTYDTSRVWHAWSFPLIVFCIFILLVLTEFHLTCSGQVAVIIPRQVISGLVGKRVKVIAVAKHHTVISTDGGEVYTWGSNRGWFLQASFLPWNLLSTSKCGTFFAIL
jgi:alpha-tubulin suppressor-like RCC1 family protein